MLTFLRLALAATLLVSCKPTEKKEKEQGAAPPPAAKAPAAWKKELTRDCPAYARGADVKVEDIPSGVRVTVTSADADKVDEIRANARYLEGASAAGAGADALDFGDGPTSDRNSNCPIVLDGTSVAVAEIAGGATLDVTAKDAAGVDLVRKQAHERHETLTIMKEALGN
jgi:hypothetical protein